MAGMQLSAMSWAWIEDRSAVPDPSPTAECSAIELAGTGSLWWPSPPANRNACSATSRTAPIRPRRASRMALASIAPVTNRSSKPVSCRWPDTGRLRARPAGMLFTGASVLAAINSMVGGVGVALLAARVASLVTGAALAVGITAAVVLFGLHLLYQQQRAASLVPRLSAPAVSA
jgi:hypothetical protein